MVRIGQGFDVHAFCPGDHIMLGGVKIDHEFGVQAHSDGDVLIHALCDALLGAAGLGDIGRHFPDSDKRYENVNSREFLRIVKDRIGDNDFTVCNIDLTFVAERPKIAAYVPQMVANIANDLDIEDYQVNIKATTTEHLGFCGRQEGLAAFAVVLIENANT